MIEANVRGTTGLRVLETIPDLVRDPRADPFWRIVDPLLEHAGIIENLVEIPNCPNQYRICITEVRRLWQWIQLFKSQDFNAPKGCEIRVRHPTWWPHDGMHRATALRVLGRRVPALLVDNWQLRGKIMRRGQLGQTQTAAATATSIYSPPTDVEATDLSLTCVNTTGAADTIRVYQDDDGTTYTAATAIYYDLSIDAGETLVLSLGPMRNSAGNVAVESATANAVTFTLHGTERLA